MDEGERDLFSDNMAYLLGSKSCIESLRVDIDDLETVIHDIIGKTGSIKCHSWKFPDRLATDVEIKELLERHQHGKNELDNQVSHVILFELVIDRLLLVLHGSWRYLHDIQTKLLPNIIDSSSTINQQTSLSVGLVVKKYWNKLLHLFTLLQQYKLRLDDRERVDSNLSHQFIRTHPKGLKPSLPTVDKHCQTIQTSFSPCSSCTQLQQYFRDSSNSIVHLCNLYNLPSSLAYHRCSTSIIPEWLSSDDINQWLDCQTKDFDRLSKHLEYLSTTFQQMKSELENRKIQSQQQNESNQRLQQIIQDGQQSKKVLEELHQNQLKLNEQNALKLNEQIRLLTTQKNNLEQQIIDLNEEIRKFESSRNQLKILTDDRIKSDELRKTFEENCIRLQTELDVIKRDLDERNRDLKKERFRIETMIRQEEVNTSKQSALIKSNEDLSQECQLLKKQISELGFQRDQLQTTNHHALQEIIGLKSTIEQLHDHRSSQITSVTAMDNQLHEMKNQMRANEHRLDLLQRENETLRASLEKLSLANHPPVVTQEPRNQSYFHINETIQPRQTPLWLLSNEILDQQAFTEPKPVTPANYIPRFSENDYAANGWIKPEPDVIPLQARPPTRAHTSHAIPPAAEHEMILGKGRPKVSTRRNISSAGARRSSASNLTHRFSNS